ncbi:MAG: DUF1707 SHOCT-like domain-containing protein [Streptosporangiaceae bacterium]
MEPQDPRARWTVSGGYMRASDEDRERVIEILKTAFVQGRLSQGELTMRTGEVLSSRTYAELADTTADIPARRVATVPPRPPAPARTRQDERKAIARVLSLVIALPMLGVAFFDTQYGSFFILLFVGFIASSLIGPAPEGVGRRPC